VENVFVTIVKINSDFFITRAGFQHGARTLFTMGKIGATSAASAVVPKPKSKQTIDI